MVTLAIPQQAAKFPAGTSHLRNHKCINMKSLPLLKNIHKPMITQTMHTLTGQVPFRAHLVKVRLADELSCPNCGAVNGTNLHYLLSCSRYQRIRLTAKNSQNNAPQIVLNYMYMYVLHILLYSKALR